MDIGTAKPSLEERERVRHHMLDHYELSHVFSAGKFVEEATATIDDIARRGKVPIVVGLIC